jgi:hypothetical protein
MDVNDQYDRKFSLGSLAREIQANVERYQPLIDAWEPVRYVCPTACDDDCKSLCHERHKPLWERDHDALECERKVIHDDPSKA